MDSVSIHRTTDALAKARADIKVEYWGKVVEGRLPIPAGRDIEYAQERLKYWLDYVIEYEARIRKHIKDFEKIKDPISFLAWVTGVIDTIRRVINLITGG
jgi:hypothetical protein